MDDTTTTATPQAQAGDANNIDRIKILLKAKDDTQRFVGLALLKSVLDNSAELREDKDAVQDLWVCISPKFLDRLLKTGSTPSNKDSKDMLDLAVSVMHTFSVLLPESAGEDAKFCDRIPQLIAGTLHSRDETTKLLLQLLTSISSSRKGAEALMKVDDLSSLTEIAPSNPLALDVLSYAWLNAMQAPVSKKILSDKISFTLKTLIPSFSGTDAVTLLSFLGDFLRQADKALLPTKPSWLKTVVGHIKNLVASRPTPEARAAYTNAAAALLQIYPDEVSQLLFTEEKKDERPFGYLFVNLLLIDIRSSAPMLLEKLNSPEYPKISRRLASAFDVIALFIAFLLKSLDDDGPVLMDPGNLLKLRKGISETMSVTIEYLRDRWDASVAGAMGLHPDARAGTAETSTGSHNTLAWDSLKNHADEDPFTLAALRTLSLWLREDDNEALRREATGLMDMFMDIYGSSSPEDLDFRGPVLVAMEALILIDEGRELFLKQDGWKILADDLSSIIQHSTPSSEDIDLSRGTDIVRVLLPIVEQERGGTSEEWMNLITTVAAWDPPEPQDPVTQEFQVSVLQLCASLLVGAQPGLRARYKHSIGAIAGIFSRLDKTVVGDDTLREQMDDVRQALSSVR